MRLLIFLLLLATQAQTKERPLYSTQDSLRRAQVGSFSPRLALPVRVTAQKEHRFDRLECRNDPSRPLGNTFVCETN